MIFDIHNPFDEYLKETKNSVSKYYILFVTVKTLRPVFSVKTRMHSSRMRTAHSSSHHWGSLVLIPSISPWVWAWI